VDRDGRGPGGRRDHRRRVRLGQPVELGARRSLDPAVATDRATLGVPSVADHCIAVNAQPDHLETPAEDWFHFFYEVYAVPQGYADRDGQIRAYTPRGPRLDGLMKPDVTAPDNRGSRPSTCRGRRCRTAPFARSAAPPARRRMSPAPRRSSRRPASRAIRPGTRSARARSPIRSPAGCPTVTTAMVASTLRARSGSRSTARTSRSR